MDAGNPKDQSKPTLRDYEAWLVRNGHVTNLVAHRNHYELVTRGLLDTFKDSDFWQSILDGMRDVDAQYVVDHKYPLIAELPTIVIKPWRSFLEKTYRKNIVSNSHFPESPEGGWITPQNWYTRISDIVRTTIIVKYLDGVPLILEFLRTQAPEFGLQFESNLEARSDGYYGGHFLCSKDCDIPTLDWTKTPQRVVFEIQITTSIKDVIKRLLHSYYETRRVEVETPSSQALAWNYKTEEFAASYLGHILHYVEGMILEMRDRRRDGGQYGV